MYELKEGVFFPHKFFSYIIFIFNWSFIWEAGLQTFVNNQK